MPYPIAVAADRMAFAYCGDYQMSGNMIRVRDAGTLSVDEGWDDAEPCQDHRNRFHD